MASRAPSFRTNRPPITYTEMSRDDASVLIEFANFDTFMQASKMLQAAYPDRYFLTRFGARRNGHGDPNLGGRATHQIVLNTNDELTYFKLIENDLE